MTIECVLVISQNVYEYLIVAADGIILEFWCKTPLFEPLSNWQAHRIGEHEMKDFIFPTDTVYPQWKIEL